MAKFENEEKAKGCLRVIGFILVAIVALFIFGSSSEDEKKEDQLKELFKKNELGAIMDVKTQEQGIYLRKDFEIDRIHYVAYVVKETGAIDKIYTSKNKGFAIYDADKGDTTIDKREKAILKNRKNCLRDIACTFKGEVREVTKDLKSRMNYPKTFKLERVDSYDMGTYLVQNIRYSAQNAFGVPIEGFAKYKIDYETNQMQLIEAY